MQRTIDAEKKTRGDQANARALGAAKTQSKQSKQSQGRGPRGGSTGAARRGTGARAQKLEQRGETKAYRAKTSGKKKTRARSAGRQGAS